MKKSTSALMLLLALLLVSGSVFGSETYSEAPALSERVSAGELPPVAERLPVEPLVVEPYESIGEYGGVWRRTFPWPRRTTVARYEGYEGIMRWNPHTWEVIPNIARDVVVNEDSTEFLIHLREGMRWSDGAPFTSEDFRFWFEDVIGSRELTPSPPFWLMHGGELAEMEIMDEYSLRFRFSLPNPLFIRYLAEYDGFPHPKHYMEQFHINYRDKEALTREATTAGFNIWHELYQAKADPDLVDNPAYPVITAWVLENITATRLTYTRNPYYWKVDPAGQQLPYLDRLVREVVDSVDVQRMQAMAGEIDYALDDIGQQLDLLPLFLDNQERGDYRIINVEYVNEVNALSINFNMNHHDPVLRDIFRDVRFRQAMSVAIDREDVIDLVLFGQGTPTQPSYTPDSPHYYPEQRYAYTQYDPELANQLLDEMGLDQRDAAGYRLRPDGERLRILIQYRTDWRGQYWQDFYDAISPYWEAVGVQIAAAPAARDLKRERQAALDYDASFRVARAGPFTMFTVPGPFIPTTSLDWGRGYRYWYDSDGEQGHEPTGDILRTLELHEQMQLTADQAEIAALWREILDLYKDNLWCLGIADHLPKFAIVKNDFRNVPLQQVRGALGVPGSYNPETFYWRSKD